jgi:hypothetical protein
MALPKDPEARNYYRSALQWLDDANFILHQGDRKRAAVYLAGYTVECLLKALILSTLPRKKIIEMQKAKVLYTHNLESLKSCYLANGGPPFPKQILNDFLTISDWDTELRYQPRAINYRDAIRFLEAVARIAEWADGRI